VQNQTSGLGDKAETENIQSEYVKTICFDICPFELMFGDFFHIKLIKDTLQTISISYISPQSLAAHKH